MAKIREKRIDQCFETIKSLHQLPSMKGFVIGRTARAIWKRADEYHREEFDHVVALADRLTSEQAEQLEEALQLRCGLGQGNPVKRLKKYHHEKKSYRRSSSDKPEHSIYMAWWDK